jgi:hypothetical protein
MNHPYIDELITENRTGILIKLIKVNVYKWSVDDFQYIFEQCIEHKLYHIFYFMMDYFVGSDCISFYDNKEFMDYDNIFVWSCSYGHTDIAKYLLSDEITNKYPDIDPCADDNEGIMFACLNDHIDMVKYLLSDEVTGKYSDIDPYAQNNCGLRWACKYCRVDMVKYLLLEKVTNNYPKLHPKNLDKQLKIDIERLLGYHI